MEIHANLAEDRNIFEDHAVGLNESVPFLTCPGQFEDEQLVWLLPIHTQDLAADDGEVFFILALFDCNDLVRLSGIGF